MRGVLGWMGDEAVEVLKIRIGGHQFCTKFLISVPKSRSKFNINCFEYSIPSSWILLKIHLYRKSAEFEIFCASVVKCDIITSTVDRKK